MKRIDASTSLRNLAAAQAGVITLRQATGFGLGRHSLARLIDQGHWRRIGPSLVYLHWQPPTWAALAWAGVLYAEPGARVGGEAAGHLHGLIDQPPDEIVIMIPQHRRLACRTPWIFQRERPGIRSARSPGDPPRLTVEDTVLDLCLDERSAVHWITTAVQRRRTTPARLRHAAQQRSQLPNRAILLDLLTETRNGVESPLEHRYLRDVERAHGLARGTRQLRRVGAAARHDVGYREFWVLVELDGRLGHEGTERFRDLRRDNRTAVEGLMTLRYGWADITEHPCAVARQVAELLIRGGWTGMPTPCPRCVQAGPDSWGIYGRSDPA